MAARPAPRPGPSARRSRWPAGRVRRDAASGSSPATSTATRRQPPSRPVIGTRATDLVPRRLLDVLEVAEGEGPDREHGTHDEGDPDPVVPDHGEHAGIVRDAARSDEVMGRSDLAMICTNRDRRATAAGRLPRSGRPRWIPGERDVATAGEREVERPRPSLGWDHCSPTSAAGWPPARPAPSGRSTSCLVLVSLLLVLPLGLAIALVVLAPRKPGAVRPERVGLCGSWAKISSSALCTGRPRRCSSRSPAVERVRGQRVQAAGRAGPAATRVGRFSAGRASTSCPR